MEGVLNLEPELQTFLVSIWDARVGMPLGVVLGLQVWEAFLFGVAGGLAVAPFLLLFRHLLKFFTWLTPRFTNWLFKMNAKNRKNIEKYGYWGLFIFVAIPLPGTGAWAGALIAGFLQMGILKSFLAILIGISFSGLIPLLFTHSLVN